MPEYDLIVMTLVIFVPAAFALLSLLIPSKAVETLRWWALFGVAVNLVLTLCLVIDYYALLDSRSDRGIKSLHHPKTMLESRGDEAFARAYPESGVPEPPLGRDWYASLPWIERFDIRYTIGIDSISLPLILLTAIVMFLAVIASWGITKHVKAYFALLLILQSGVQGAFMALDLFLFYVFYEVMLLPMYFLIGLWGGGRRKYAALKFVLYTLLGSLCILVAFLGLYFNDVRDFVDKPAVEARAKERVMWQPAGLTHMEEREYHTFDLLTHQRAGQAAMLIRENLTDKLAPRDPLLGPGRLSAVEAEPKPDDGKIKLLGRGANLAEARRHSLQPALLFLRELSISFVCPALHWLCNKSTIGAAAFMAAGCTR